MSYKVFIDEFPTMDSFWKFCETAPNNEAFEGMHKSSKTGAERKAFTGTETLDEALDLFRNGYDAGAKAIRCDASGFSRQVQRAQVRNYYVGACPNVPRAMQGLPDAMRQVYRVPQKQRVVSVFYDASAHCGVGARDMQRAATLFYGAVNALERAGVRVEITVGEAVKFTSNDAKTKLLVSPAIVVKRASERADTGRLGFVLTHPSFLRRLIFKFTETCPHITRDYREGCYGYGTPAAIDNGDSAAFVEEMKRRNPNAVYIGVSKILNEKTLGTEQGILDYMQREAAAGGAQ